MIRHRFNSPSFVVQEALKGIVCIKPLIHRIEMSGDYSYKQLCSVLGKLKIKSIPPKSSSKYGIHAYGHLNKMPLMVSVNPVGGYLPQCHISMVHHDHQILCNLNRLLPGLKIISVEYAIDFHCKDHDAVSDLFYLFRRYCYFPYAKNTTIVGEEFQGLKEPRKNNSLYKVNASSKYNKCQYKKIYERGDDKNNDLNKINNVGWLHTKVYRLRFEVTLKSRGRKLHNLELRELSDFIKDAKFSEVFFSETEQHQIQFMRFKKHSKLPSESDDYNACDKNGNIESLQEEIFMAKKLGINTSLFMEQAPLLLKFTSEIQKQVKLFDWSLTA